MSPRCRCSPSQGTTWARSDVICAHPSGVVDVEGLDIPGPSGGRPQSDPLPADRAARHGIHGTVRGKVSTVTRSCGPTITLAGFKSRWAMPCLCGPRRRRRRTGTIESRPPSMIGGSGRAPGAGAPALERRPVLVSGRRRASTVVGSDRVNRHILRGTRALVCGLGRKGVPRPVPSTVTGDWRQSYGQNPGESRVRDRAHSVDPGPVHRDHRHRREPLPARPLEGVGTGAHGRGTAVGARRRVRCGGAHGAPVTMSGKGGCSMAAGSTQPAVVAPVTFS